jgi:hypothetical protein
MFTPSPINWFGFNCMYIIQIIDYRSRASLIVMSRFTAGHSHNSVRGLPGLMGRYGFWMSVWGLLTLLSTTPSLISYFHVPLPANLCFREQRWVGTCVFSSLYLVCNMTFLCLLLDSLLTLH